jgi:hypothetical protein
MNATHVSIVLVLAIVIMCAALMLVGCQAPLR